MNLFTIASPIRLPLTVGLHNLSTAQVGQFIDSGWRTEDLPFPLSHEELFWELDGELCWKSKDLIPNTSLSILYDSLYEYGFEFNGKVYGVNFVGNEKIVLSPITFKLPADKSFLDLEVGLVIPDTLTQNQAADMVVALSQHTYNFDFQVNDVSAKTVVQDLINHADIPDEVLDGCREVSEVETLTSLFNQARRCRSDQDLRELMSRFFNQKLGRTL